MAFAELPWIDSVAHYDGNNFAGKWTALTAGVNNSGGRTGLNGRLSISNGDCHVTLLGTYTTLFAGCAYNPSLVGGAQVITFTNSFSNAVPTAQISQVGDGTLTVTASSNTGESITSSHFGNSGRPLASGQWYFIEMSAQITSTTQMVVNVRVNNATQVSSLTLNLTGGHTWGTQSFSRFSFGGNTGIGQLFCDMYVNSTAFQGDSIVVALFPNGNGAHTQWTSSNNTVPNWQNANSVPPTQTPTKLNFDLTVGNEDAYNMTQLPAVANSVLAVQGLLWCDKDSANTATIQPLYHSNNNDQLGENFNPSLNSYQYFREGSANSVFTNNSWTVAEVNGMQFGMNRSA